MAKLSPGRRVRDALANGTIQTFGCYDAISAKLIEAAGLPMASISGSMLSASYGFPDIGMLSMSEIAEASGRIAAAVDIPVLADADTGYGGIPNIVHAVQTFEKKGVAGIKVEDQVSPKRCAGMGVEKVVVPEEMQATIAAAVAAKEDPDFMIVARTDSIAATGFEDALRRVQMYEEAGADMIFLQRPQSPEQIAQCASAISIPLMISSPEGSRIRLYDLDMHRKLGVSVVVYATSMMLAGAAAMEKALARITSAGINEQDLDSVYGREALNDLLDLDYWRAREIEALNRFSLES
ncbi:MAG TPA: isocitrate lyase/PEP mutase family protein [Devosiaceae bacterium]|jgi:2-methylisocitrate lyase-like PEP mutase family enzyme